MRAQRITAPVGLVVALLLPVALLRPPALADGDGDGQDLAQASQNPVGDIIRVLGMLVQNVWSVAGSDSANDVNSFLLQTFANYNMEGGWYLNTSPVITADWEQDSGERWTVPLGLRIGRLLKNGKLPVDYRLAAYWNVEKLSFAPDWNLQFTVKLLFPKSLAKAPGACLTTIRSLVSPWALAAI